MKALLALAVIATSLFTARTVSANTLIFSEDFGTIENDERVLPNNSGFTYIGWNPASTPSQLHSWNPTGQNAALHIVSGNGGQTGAQTGIGVRFEESYSVVTLSLDINLQKAPNASGIYFGFGTSNDASQLFYHSSNQGSTRDQPAPFAAESLAVFKIKGNTPNAQNPEGFGNFQTLDSSGTWQSLSASRFQMGTDEWHNIHLTINGGPTALTLGDGTILAQGTMAVYVDQVLITTFTISNSVSADNFRIYTQGNSTTITEYDALVDNIKIWDGAFAPIPEPSAVAMIAASAALGALLTRRKKSR